MGTTDDRNDPRLTRGADEAPVEQAEVYLVLSDDERARGFVRPVRSSYLHATCGATTTMGLAIAEATAANPTFYGATYCCSCRMYRPVGEFRWVDDGTVVGS